MTTNKPASSQQRLGRPRNQQMHKAILQATLDLLVERGFEGLSYEAVAARANVSKPTIYLRWKHKADLVAEAIESWRPVVSYVPTGNLRDDLVEIANQFLNSFSTLSARRLALVTLTMLTTEDTVKQSWWLGQGQLKTDSLRSIFLLAIESGQLSPTANIDALLLLFSALLMHLSLLGSIDTSKSNHDVLMAAIDQLIGQISSAQNSSR
jgi:AcrR family transcriptional regulator